MSTAPAPSATTTEEKAVPHETQQATTSPRRALTRWVPALVVVGSLLAGLLLAGLHYVLQPPTYSATTLVSAVPAPGRERGAAALDSLGQLRYGQALARLAVLPQVAGPHLRAAGLADKADKPNDTITVSAAPDTAVFTVTAQDRDPARAKAAADAVAAAAVKICETQDLPVRAVVSPAATPSAPTPGLTVRLVLGAVIGIGLGCVLLLIRADRRRTA